jgi:hypothetical protein
MVIVPDLLLWGLRPLLIMLAFSHRRSERRE